MTNLYTLFDIARRPWFIRRAGLLVLAWVAIFWASVIAVVIT